MSLNFNFAKVADHEALHSDEREWSITEHLIWHSLSIGMSGINEKNLKKFTQRYFALHLSLGSTPKQMVKASDIKRRVGLVTNVTNRSDSSFAKHIAELVFCEARRRIGNELETKEAC